MKNYFFYHFANSRNTIPIKFLLESFGHTGYSVYFQMLEYLCESKNNILPFDEKMKSFFAKEFKIEVSLLDEIINTCVYFELFCVENNLLFSQEILDHMDKVKEISAKRSNSAKKKNKVVEKIEPIEVNEDVSYLDVMQDIEVNEFGIREVKENSETIKQDYKKETTIFSNKIIEHFQVIPEKHYMKNKLEKRALELIFEMINCGLFSKFSDIEGHLDDLMLDVIKTGNPSFYVTTLYNKLSLEIKEASKTNSELKPFMEQFKYLSNSKE